MQPTDCSMDILDYDCLGVFIKFFNGAMRSLEAVLANLPLPFSGVLKSTRNTINPDTHCVSVLWWDMHVAYLMTSKLQNLQGHIKFWV